MANRYFSKSSISFGSKLNRIFDQTTYQTISCEILVVAGGGGGSGYIHGGAGAGGLLYYGADTTPKTPNGSSYALPKGKTIPITVGAGGSGYFGFNIGPINTNTAGSNSIVASLVAYGGGTSQQWDTNGVGQAQLNGGSGAGGPHDGGLIPGSGVTEQGNNGGWLGVRTGSNYPGGGGGGAGATGGNPGGGNSAGGNGGAGLTYSISSAAVTYAGGGGAGSGYNRVGYGSGGSGGGGSNGAGTVNTGGGGGGSESNANGGGSGIVIIRYADSNAAAITTGSPTVTVTGGYRIYKFTGDGTITLS